MGKAVDPRIRWNERQCSYCGNSFWKSPMYATCGHPRCVKVHRKSQKKLEIGTRDQTTTGRYGTWEPPDIYAPDVYSRSQVWNLLRDTKVLTPKIVQLVAAKVKITPGEVFGIWNSIRKENLDA